MLYPINLLFYLLLSSLLRPGVFSIIHLSLCFRRSTFLLFDLFLLLHFQSYYSIPNGPLCLLLHPCLCPCFLSRRGGLALFYCIVAWEAILTHIFHDSSSRSVWLQLTDFSASHCLLTLFSENNNRRQLGNLACNVARLKTVAGLKKSASSIKSAMAAAQECVFDHLASFSTK